MATPKRTREEAIAEAMERWADPLAALYWSRFWASIAEYIDT